MPIELSADKVDPANPAGANYLGIVQDALAAKFPDVTGRQERRLLRGLISTGSGVFLRQAIEADPSMLGKTVEFSVPLDDFADLYLKGLLAKSAASQALNGVTVSAATGDVDLTFGDDTVPRLARGAGATEEAGVLRLTSGASSLLVDVDGGTVKLTQIGPGNTAKGMVLEALAAPVAAPATATLRTIITPESSRKISDHEIVWLDNMKAHGPVESRCNSIFFFTGASREPELAGIWGAVVGSFLTMIVTLAIAFPIGVSAAIYLEEFAPKNRMTNMIEVNINNLAAVPSIVFGLLGLAVFLNLFGMPRSAPVVGGMVLALMTLADHHHRVPRLAAGGAAVDPRGSARHRRIQDADRLPSRAAAGHAGHHDRHDPRHGACARRNGAAADDRHGRLHRRHSRRLHRSGDDPSSPDLHVGRFPRSRLPAEDLGGDPDPACIPGHHERHRGDPAQTLRAALVAEYKE